MGFGDTLTKLSLRSVVAGNPESSFAHLQSQGSPVNPLLRTAHMSYSLNSFNSFRGGYLKDYIWGVNCRGDYGGY